MKKDMILTQATFLIYTNRDGSIKIETKLLDETIWLSQKQLAELYQTSVANVSIHIRNVFSEGELVPESVIKDFLITASDGKSYHTMHYNLDMIISVGYRVKSQNKMHWAGHGHTAAEIIYQRANADKPYMGLTNWPGSKIRKADTEIAKNYLNPEELDILNRIVSMYLDFAELQAINRSPMYMKDWIVKLDEFLKLSGRENLEHAGSIAHDDAAQKARLEYERWHKVELTAPTEAENHFVEAVQDLKQIGKVIKAKVKK